MFPQFPLPDSTLALVPADFSWDPKAKPDFYPVKAEVTVDVTADALVWAPPEKVRL